MLLRLAQAVLEASCSGGSSGEEKGRGDAVLVRSTLCERNCVPIKNHGNSRGPHANRRNYPALLGKNYGEQPLNKALSVERGSIGGLGSFPSNQGRVWAELFRYSHGFLVHEVSSVRCALFA